MLFKFPPALRHRDFRLLWAGQAVSIAGSRMQAAAILWQVYAITGSPLALGAVGLAHVLPLLAVSLFAGVAADVFDRRKLMLGTQTCMLLLALLLGGLTVRGLQSAADIVARVESHEFPPLPFLYWRNTDVRFLSTDALLIDLKRQPESPVLTRPPPAEDQLVLEALLRDTEVRDLTRTPDRVRLLWDVAQVPDFRKVKPETHARLMGQVFRLLCAPAARLDQDWMSRQVDRIDRIDGDIHVLMDRIAAIRTWTYVSNRPGWVEHALAWQEQTRAIEDRLSDALHAKLTHQFVDRRTSHLVKKLRSDDQILADVDGDGGVSIDGHRLGRLQGLRFAPERTGAKTADRAVLGAANAALRPVVASRVAAITAAIDGEFLLDDLARVVWQREPIARLTAGPDPLRPKVEVPDDDRLDAGLRLRVTERLQRWVADHVRSVLGPMVAAAAAPAPGAVRGIVFQIGEGLGAVRRDQVERQLASLDDAGRTVLAKLGIRFGIDSVFYPALLKSAPIRLRALLWIAAHPDSLPPPPPPGRVSIATDPAVPADYYWATGYRPIAGTAYRIDMLERFAAVARKAARDGHKILPPEHLSLLGITAEAALAVLAALGFTARVGEAGIGIAFDMKRARRQRDRKSAPTAVNPDSPFAKLREMTP